MLANFYALHSGTATPYDGRRQLPDDDDECSRIQLCLQIDQLLSDSESNLINKFKRDKKIKFENPKTLII